MSDNSEWVKNQITTLDDQALEQKNKIITIELQIERAELTADGNDEYFEWRKRALSAVAQCKKKRNSIRRQSTYYRKIIMDRDTKATAKLKRKIKHQELLLSHKSITKPVADAMVARSISEQEKTKRVIMAHKKERLIAKEFKKMMKKLLGEEEYIKTIQEAHKTAEESAEWQLIN